MHAPILVVTTVAMAAGALAHPGHEHSFRVSDPSLLKRHAQPAGHPVHELFRRGAKSYPAQDVSGPTPLPAWVSAYQTAKAANQIPSHPVATYIAGSPPQYPQGAGETSRDPDGLCAWTWSVCNATDDIIDVPDGKIGLSFDDGPQPASTALLSYLKEHSLNAMHFMIGSRIVDNPTIFSQTLSQGDALAVHTWSHPYMTTMSDIQILGELGWTMQIIYDRSGGLLPAFWRPPYGDVDNRVRAIAREVFGLRTIIWNQDTRDWCLSDATPGKSACPVGNGPQTSAQLDAELQGFYGLPRTPGLVILEHEHQTRAVAGFVNNFESAQESGWEACMLVDCLGLDWYQNAEDNQASPRPLSLYGAANGLSGNTSVPSAGNATAASLPQKNQTSTSGALALLKPPPSSSSHSPLPSSSSAPAASKTPATSSGAASGTQGQMAALRIAATVSMLALVPSVWLW